MVLQSRTQKLSALVLLSQDDHVAKNIICSWGQLIEAQDVYSKLAGQIGATHSDSVLSSSEKDVTHRLVLHWHSVSAQCYHVMVLSPHTIRAMYFSMQFSKPISCNLAAQKRHSHETDRYCVCLHG